MREEIELLCPKCSSHRIVARTKDRNVLYLACDACDRTLTQEEVWEQVAQQSQATLTIANPIWIFRKVAGNASSALAGRASAP